MPDYPEPDDAREEALEAAVRDLGKASTVEEVAAALEAIRQVPIDVDRMLNAIRVPDDAGEYEAALRTLLERIPDGWGRWISCGPGWYPILADIEERLSELDPHYEVNQIKEKFGTLGSTAKETSWTATRSSMRPRLSRREPASSAGP